MKNTRMRELKIRLAQGKKVLLSGGCGTEIQRRGVATKLPLWSAAALLSHPEVVCQIHKDYILAGAEVITTNTFRTNHRTLEKVGLGEEAKKWTQLAFDLADKARKECGREVIIGGSLAPLEDCYRPDLTPSMEALKKEHAEQAKNLAESGVDFIFVETMNCIREAVVAVNAARQTGLEAAVSFVCDEKGNLLSGEAIEEGVKKILPYQPFAVLTNCAPPKRIEKSLDRLLACSTIPVGVYANGYGYPDAEVGWKGEARANPHQYLEYVKKWLSKGVAIVGGCCGTTPEYIHLIKKTLF